jgi:hypothetical protein
VTLLLDRLGFVVRHAAVVGHERRWFGSAAQMQ